MFNKMNENVYIIMEKDQFDGLKDFIQIYQYLENQLQIYHLIIHISMGVWYFPRGIFPRAASQVTISKVATSQICNFPSGNFLMVRLDLLRRPRLQWGPSAATRKGQGCRAMRLGKARVAERCGQNRLGKLPLGKVSINNIIYGTSYNIYDIYICISKEINLHILSYTDCVFFLKVLTVILRSQALKQNLMRI